MRFAAARANPAPLDPSFQNHSHRVSALNTPASEGNSG